MILKGIIDGACAIHVTSESERDQLSLLGLEDACVVIPLSVILPELNKVMRKRGCDLKLLFMSRIHPKKGLPVLIEAVSILRHRGISVVLTVAGEGSKTYLSEIKRLIRDLSLNDVVNLAGFVEGEAKVRLLEEADLFVLPSYQENFGLAVVEAMAAGLPVVVSEQMALADEIMENGAGVKVPVDRPEVLADKISTLVDSAYLEQMGSRARKLVERRFSADRQGNQLLKLYKSIVLNL